MPRDRGSAQSGFAVGGAGSRMSAVSVIIPAYNAERYLPAALASVRRQSFDDFESIIVDDGSTDGTHELACRLSADDARVRVLRKQNGGVGSARNAGAGIRSTDGRYLLFLGAAA